MTRSGLTLERLSTCSRESDAVRLSLSPTYTYTQPLQMIYSLLASSVLLIHLGFILFVLFGGIFGFWWRKVIILHIPAIFWGAFVEFSGWICPLTPLENKFRIRAGELGYSGGFVENYIQPLIYIEGLTAEMQIIFGTIVILLNLFVYGWMFKRWVRRR